MYTLCQVKSNHLTFNGLSSNEINYLIEAITTSNVLDYIITRKDCNIISDFLVSDFNSNHRELHASLQCILPHPVRKQIAVRAIRRKNELIWRKTPITINFNIYYDSCTAVKKDISIRKAELMEQIVINCEGDQKKLFSLIHSQFGSKKITVLPEYTSSFTLVSSVNMFFMEKIHNIKMEFLLLEACLTAYSFVDIDTIMPCSF